MKINNPTKIASRKILIEKMNQYNTDEENRVLKEKVIKHNRQTGDNLIFYITEKFTFTYNLPHIEIKRRVIPEKH